jgi:hypothetical protein
VVALWREVFGVVGSNHCRNGSALVRVLQGLEHLISPSPGHSYPVVDEINRGCRLVRAAYARKLSRLLSEGAEDETQL